jgi:hypothetical protein
MLHGEWKLVAGHWNRLITGSLHRLKHPATARPFPVSVRSPIVAKRTHHGHLPVVAPSVRRLDAGATGPPPGRRAMAAARSSVGQNQLIGQIWNFY